MNTETGEWRSFLPNENIPTGWISFSPGELVKLNGGFFRVHSVNAKGSRITLKSISRIEYESQVKPK